MTPNLWPHQSQALEDIGAAVAGGWRRVLVTAPTGAGKTRIMCELINLWENKRVALYTNRKLLLEQLDGVLDRAAIDHGVRAAGWSDETRFWPVQVCSLQTERARVYVGKTWQLHDADLVIVDEAHMQKADTAAAILDRHHADGAAVVGFTATPLELAHLYDRLIAAGTNSQLRECGALVMAHHYGPDEPDLRHIKKVPLGVDLSENQQRKIMMVPGIVGRVAKWFQLLNPQGAPGLLFAPGVQESVFFTQELSRLGIRSAHIDGQSVWLDGKFYRSDAAARQAVLDGSKCGEIKLICNRFVLREGIDMPWLQHGILATVFGSIQSYLQAAGRLLRAFPGKDHCTLQDHGGNWWRHRRFCCLTCKTRLVARHEV